MAPSVRRPVSFNGFKLGINNVAPDSDVPRDESGLPVSARDAENVDFRGPNGQMVRRAGVTQVLALTDAHSAYDNPEGFPYIVCRDADRLIAIAPDYSVTVLRTGLGTAPASYTLFNDDLLWTVDKAATGRLSRDLTQRPLGLPRHPGIGAAVPAAGGGLAAGTYRLAAAYMDENGEIGGASAPIAVTLAAGEGVEVTIPVPAEPEIETVRVYITAANGTEFYAARDVVAGVTSQFIGDTPRGDACDTFNLSPLPPGRIIRALNGYVLMAVDNQCYSSRALYAGLHHAGYDRIGFKSDLWMMEPVGSAADAGVYFGDERRVYWAPGASPKQFDMKVVMKKGVVPGSARWVDASVFPQLKGDAVFFQNSDGVPCLALPGGVVEQLAKDRVAMMPFESAATLVREIDGKRQIVIAGKGGTERQKMGVGDSVEVLHYRNGIPVP